jgi:hypothetical protein
MPDQTKQIKLTKDVFFKGMDGFKGLHCGFSDTTALKIIFQLLNGQYQ